MDEETDNYEKDTEEVVEELGKVLKCCFVGSRLGAILQNLKCSINERKDDLAEGGEELLSEPMLLSKSGDIIYAYHQLDLSERKRAHGNNFVVGAAAAAAASAGSTSQRRGNGDSFAHKGRVAPDAPGGLSL